MAEDRPPTRNKLQLPHSRSISLQMLTHRPTNVPLEEKMYTESLQPLRSPPDYSNDGMTLAPALAHCSIDSHRGSSGDTSIASPQYSAGSTSTSIATPTPPPPPPSTRKVDTTPPAPSITSMAPRVERSGRSVSMPPLQNSSPYDSMFTFSSELPEDFSQTIGSSLPPLNPIIQAPSTKVPAYSPAMSSPFSNQYVKSDAVTYQGAEETRANYIHNGRSVSNPHAHVSQPGRTTNGSVQSRTAPINGEAPRPKGTRRPSMLHTLGSWLEKKQDQSGR